MLDTETTNVAEALTQGECVARGVMPQVDEVDLPELLAFLESHGIKHVHRIVDSEVLKGQQKIVPSKVKAIVRGDMSWLKDKPSLVSHDWLIVDGNHRVAALRIKKMPAPILLFNMVFSELLPIIFTFPKAYAYGDGKYHPVRN